MMVACDKTVTFARLRDDGDGYDCTTLDGVSWFGKTELAREGRGVTARNPVKIRIPESSLPAGFMPEVGDIAILGAASPADPQDARPHARVMGVGINLRGGLSHVAVTCV